MTFLNARPDVMIVLARDYEYVGYIPPKPVTRPAAEVTFEPGSATLTADGLAGAFTFAVELGRKLVGY